MARHIVATSDEIPEGGRKLVTIRGREIGIFHQGGEYFAILNRCPHQGGELCKGTLIGLVTSSEPGSFDYSRPGEILKCPWHGWEFDIRTGQSYCDPNRVRARAYAVTMEDGAALAKETLVVETFSVSVESRYVLIEMN